MKIDTFKILILSQVVLSIQLPITLIPLLVLCRRWTIMGSFRSNSVGFLLAIAVSVVIIALNFFLLYSTIFA